MSAFTINIPIRAIDADDVKNAFAFSYGYSDTVEIGGVIVPNPISKEEFVKQKCINFMLDVTKSHLVKTEEIAAKEAAEGIATERASEVTQWFDNRRLESIGGISIFQNFPSVDDLSLTTNKNEAVGFTPTGTDPDNLPLFFTITKNPEHGSVSGVSPNFIYFPSNRYFGNDSFKIKANNGSKFSLEKTIPVTINRTLTSVDALYSLRKNQNLSINLFAHDNVGEVIFSIVDNPTNGVLNGTNPITYTPNTNFVGTDEFTFTSQDDTLIGSPGTITIDVNTIIAESRIYNLIKNEPLVISFNALNAIGPFTFSIVDQPSHGVLSGSNEIIYTPEVDFVGSDSFTFTVSDELDTSEIGTITLLISES
jgi:hypothetical protein